MMDAAMLQAKLAALLAAEIGYYAGQTVSKITYDGGSVEYSKPPSLSDIRRAIWETRSQLARALGGRGSGGAIVPVFR